jgi:hypothetical protein
MPSPTQPQLTQQSARRGGPRSHRIADAMVRRLTADHAIHRLRQVRSLKVRGRSHVRFGRLATIAQRSPQPQPLRRARRHENGRARSRWWFRSGRHHHGCCRRRSPISRDLRATVRGRNWAGGATLGPAVARAQPTATSLEVEHHAFVGALSATAPYDRSRSSHRSLVSGCLASSSAPTRGSRSRPFRRWRRSPRHPGSYPPRQRQRLIVGETNQTRPQHSPRFLQQPDR